MNYSELLNEEQLKPVLDTEGAVLVLAGAGSGKTRVLTYRIAYLIGEKHVDPHNILAITFTNKAANEMKERVQNVTGAYGVWISTFHSMCARILRSEIEVDGVYTRNFSIYTDTESDRIVSRIIKELALDDGDLKKLARFHISYAKNHAYTPDEYATKIAGVSHSEAIAHIYRRYEKVLRENNALDFDDLLLKTLMLFKAHPDVLARYAERFRYIHVDEFQDTNKIQFLLVRMLASKHGNVFVVGDDDQSIYGWRGAEVGNIADFKKLNPGCKLYKLERNYRSTRNILDLANKVIANNSERLGKTLWTEGDKGNAVVFRSLYDDRQEADYVIGEILNLRNAGCRLKDIAILVRVSSITKTFEDKLTLYNLPFRLIGGMKFYDRAEVKDFLAYLKCIANPRDAESLKRIINVPNRKIGEATVAKLELACSERGMTMLEGVLDLPSLGMSSALNAKLAPFGALMRDLWEHRDMPIGDFADFVDDAVAFDQYYDCDDEEEGARLENIANLVQSIKEFAKDNPDAGLEEYLQSVTLISDTDDLLDDDKLTLATVHGVKGLEFDVVFIVGLEEGIFPTIRQDTTAKNLEEERRIMYVAVTRARKRLYLTCAQSRFRFGRRENSLASRFLVEGGFIKKPEPIPERQGSPVHSVRAAMGKIGLDIRDLPKRGERKEPPAYAKRPPVAGKDIGVFKIGMTVKHSRFGVGEIVDISGENAKIKFKDLGVKMFNMRLAPIEPVQ